MGIVHRRNTRPPPSRGSSSLPAFFPAQMRSVLLGASAELRQVFAAHIFRLGAFYYVSMACAAVCIGAAIAPLQGRPGLLLAESAVVPILASFLSLRRSRIATLAAVAVGFAYLSASIFGAAYASTESAYASLTTRRALAVVILGGNFCLRLFSALRPAVVASPSVHAMDARAALRAAAGDALGFALGVSWRTALAVYLSARLVRDYTAWDVYAAVEQNLIANVFFCSLTRFSGTLLRQLKCQPMRELDSVPVLLTVSASLSSVFASKAYVSLLSGYSEIRRAQEEDVNLMDAELRHRASVRFGGLNGADGVDGPLGAGGAKDRLGAAGPSSASSDQGGFSGAAGIQRASRASTASRGSGTRKPLLGRVRQAILSFFSRLSPWGSKKHAKAPASIAPFSQVDYYLISQFAAACSRVLRLSEWPALTTDYSTMVLSQQARELSDADAYQSRAWMAPALEFVEAKLRDDLFPMHIYTYQGSSPLAVHFVLDALVHCMLFCSIQLAGRQCVDNPGFYCGLAGRLVQAERRLHNVYAGMPVEFCGIDGLLLDRKAIAQSGARSVQASVASRQDLDAPVAVAGAGLLDADAGHPESSQRASAILIKHNRMLQNLLPAANDCTVMLDITGDEFYEAGKSVTIAPQRSAQPSNFRKPADAPTWKGKKLVFLLAFLVGGYPLVDLNSRKDLEQELTVWSVLLHALGLDADASARGARRARARARRAARRKLGKPGARGWFRLWDPLSRKLAPRSPAQERSGPPEPRVALCLALGQAASALSDVVASVEATYMYSEVRDLILLTLRLAASALYSAEVRPGLGFGKVPQDERDRAMRALRLASQRLIE